VTGWCGFELDVPEAHVVGDKGDHVTELQVPIG
jgi:hypothetical protein